MALLEPKVPFPKTIEYYKQYFFSFDTKQIHPIDQIDLHKQAGETIYSTLTSSVMATSKMQVSPNNVQSQLKIEKIFSRANDTKIKSLDDIVIKMGYDPSNVKVVEEMIKRKNVDIQDFKKQLKLPTTEDPQTKEVGELEKGKERMFKIIVEQNLQIQRTETELESRLKEKEQQPNEAKIIPIETTSIAGTSTTSIAAIVRVETQSSESTN